MIQPARKSWRVLLAFLLFVFLSSACTAAQKTTPPRPIDLNTATLDQLEQLPGIGPATAKAIIQFREKSGPFQRPEDLLAIHGISRTRFAKIRPYVTVLPVKKPIPPSQ